MIMILSPLPEVVKQAEREKKERLAARKRAKNADPNAVVADDEEEEEEDEDDEVVRPRARVQGGWRRGFVGRGGGRGRTRLHHGGRGSSHWGSGPGAPPHTP